MPIQPEENLSRYIVDKNYYRADGTVRHNAFMPAKADSKVSIYRSQDLTEREIWEIGQNFVANVQNKSLSGRADILARNILAEQLQLEEDTVVHPRHGNITGWPTEREKGRQIAINLAGKANLVLNRPGQGIK